MVSIKGEEAKWIPGRRLVQYMVPWCSIRGWNSPMCARIRQRFPGLPEEPVQSEVLRKVVEGRKRRY